MRVSNFTKSIVLMFAIAVGTVSPSATGEVREVQADLVKILSISPVQVTPLGAHG